MALRHLVGVILMVGLSPVVLGLQCKTDLDEPSDGWVLFRGNGLTYHYYDLSKTTNVQFPSLETSNNPLAKTVKAILAAKADYFAYTNDLQKKFPTITDAVPDKNGLVSAKSSGKGAWLMYSNVFFPPLAADQRSIADPSSNLWKWLDLTPSKSAYFVCVTLKGNHHLTKLMNLLASSNAFVHINKMSTSSPFKPYITIDKTKPANTLKNEKKLATKCQDSMPSTLGTNCFVSETFSAAKVSVFSRHRFTTPNYHQFCFEAKNQKAVVQSKPLWPNFPGQIPQSQITAVTVPGANPLACAGDLLMMKDKPGESSLLVCFEHQKLYKKLKLEGLESVEHCLPHETSGNVTVLSTVLPDLPSFNVSYIVGGYYRQSVGSVLKDNEMFSDDIGSFKVNTFNHLPLFFDSPAKKPPPHRLCGSPNHSPKKRRPTKRTVVEVQDLMTFDQKVRHNDEPVLALFCYDWCRYCRKFKSQFLKMANHPSFRHVSFIDVDLKLNHLPEAFNVLVSPTLRYKPASDGVNSKIRRYGDYDLAGYRTIEGELRVRNILGFIQRRDQIAAATKMADEEGVRQPRHHKKNSTRGMRAEDMTLQRIIMMDWDWKDEALRNNTNQRAWLELFTRLIDGLVGKEKPQRFRLTNDEIKAVVKDLKNLKHHKNKKQWVENPLVRKVLGENTVKSRPRKKDREFFKVMCDYIIMALQDTGTELRKMEGFRQKTDDLQTFASIKNNLDKYLKILKGKVKKEKPVRNVLVKPVEDMLNHVGFLQPEREISHHICSK